MSTEQGWAAPRAEGPVTGRITVPGSKSISNRALILAAIADGPSHLTGLLAARDTALMRSALVSLGVGISDSDSGATVTVTPGSLKGPANVDCGLAGTVMRFVPPVAALAANSTSIRSSTTPARPLSSAVAHGSGTRCGPPSGGPAARTAPRCASRG